MSDKPRPAEGCTLAEAFKRVFGPEAWQAARDRAEAELIRSTRGGTRWPGKPDVVRGPGGEIDFKTTALEARHFWKLDVDRQAVGLLREQFHAMLMAGERATSGRPGDPFAARIQLEPGQWRYLDPSSRSGESIAVGPNSLVYDVRVYEHAWAPAKMPVTSEMATSSPVVLSELPASAEMPAAAQGSVGKSTSSAKAQCKAWLMGLAKSDGDTRPFGTIDLLQSEAQRRYPGLSGRSFLAARAEVIEATGVNWAAPGAPKKSSH